MWRCVKAQSALPTLCAYVAWAQEDSAKPDRARAKAVGSIRENCGHRTRMIATIPTLP